MAYPAMVVGNRIARHSSLFARIAASTVALASWDVFLDPQMVAAGHWSWADPSPSLPGVAAVPLTNLAGWLVAASVVMCGATVAVRRLAPPADGFGPLAAATPVTLVAWTWLGGIVANAVFFDRPAVAVWGGLLFGLFAGPYLLLVRTR
jgi:Carotenoid biosynthesis protein